jgi:hypothetical protein
MYSFDHNGHLQVDKALTFIRSYFERCLKSGTSNEISVVIFSRLYYPQVKTEVELKEELSKHFQMDRSIKSSYFNEMGAFMKSNHVKFFQDVYLKVGVYEVSKSNAEKCIMATKRAIFYFPSLVNWNLACPAHI